MGKPKNIYYDIGVSLYKFDDLFENVRRSLNPVKKLINESLAVQMDIFVKSISELINIREFQEAIQNALGPLFEQIRDFNERINEIVGSWSIEDYDARMQSWIDTESSEPSIDPVHLVAIQPNAPPIYINDYQTEKSQFTRVAFYGLTALVIVLVLGVLFTNANNIGDSLTTFKSSGSAANYLIEFIDAGIKSTATISPLGIYGYFKIKKK